MTQLRTICLVLFLALLGSEAAFAKHARAGLIETNVAGLPTSGASGISRIVLDGVDGADCVVGHGKFAVLCTFNGVATWTAGGGGGGTGASVSDFLLTSKAAGDLPNVVNLGLLGTGFLKCTTSGATCTVSSVNTVPLTGSANNFTTAQAITPGSDVISLALRRNGAGQASNILEIQTEANAVLASIDKSGNVSAPGVAVISELTIPHSTTLPGTCVVGDAYMDTDATTGQRFYLCQSTNVWALQGDGGGGGAGTVTNTGGNLTLNALMLGAGTADAKVLASLGTTTTLLHGNAAGVPSYGAVNLAADVTGLLPVANICTATNADSSHFLRGDCTWVAPSGMVVAGAVTSSAHNKILYSDNTGLLQELTLADGQVPTAASGLIVAGTIDAAPSNATYLMQTANSGTSAEQALSSLASGCLSVTTGTGVIASSGSACGGAGTVTSITPTDGLSNADLTNTAITATGTVIRRASDLRTVQIEEEFCSPASIGTGRFKQTDLVGAVVAYGPTASPVTNNEPCAYTLTSGATSGNLSGTFLMDYGGNGVGMLGDHTTADVPWEAQFRFKLGATTNYVTYVGLGKWTAAVAPPDFMGLRFDTAGGFTDTTFQFVCIKTGAATSTTNTTITPASTNFYRLRVYSTVQGQVNFELLDNTGASLKSSLNICSSNNPSADVTLGFTVGTRTASSQSMVIGAAGYTRVMAR